jgi:hypothetical protein
MVHPATNHGRKVAAMSALLIGLPLGPASLSTGNRERSSSAAAHRSSLRRAGTEPGHAGTVRRCAPSGRGTVGAAEGAGPLSGHGSGFSRAYACAG